jgi:hypothetical protein
MPKSRCRSGLWFGLREDVAQGMNAVGLRIPSAARLTPYDSNVVAAETDGWQPRAPI